MYKLNEDGKRYRGYWQKANAILKTLEGPVGEGTIDYPGGDRFAGCFYLSYACVAGPAYAARGKYMFSDGGVVPDCWLDDHDQLMGIYRMTGRDGLRRISMWVEGKKWGIEVIEGKKPVLLYYKDDEVVEQWDEDVYYVFNEPGNGENSLEVGLPGGIVIKQTGGKVESSTARPKCEVLFANGNMLKHNGKCTFKDSKPLDGFATFYSAEYAKSIYCEWKNGEQVDKTAKWEYNSRGAKRIMIAIDPLGDKLEREAKVWNDHIEYTMYKIYDGEIKNNLPEGKGVFTDKTGLSVLEEPRRYEGMFHLGMCHGEGVYTFPGGGIRREGIWAYGKPLEKEEATEPIMLHIEWEDSEWTMSGDGDTIHKVFDIEAKVGELDIPGFRHVRIEEVNSNAVLFKEYGKEVQILTPDEPLCFANSIDGHEDHDGCVWNGDDYSMIIYWVTDEGKS